MIVYFKYLNDSYGWNKCAIYIKLFKPHHTTKQDFRTKSIVFAQGPEEMCLALENQNPSKTSEKMGYFDRVTVSLHILIDRKPRD